MSASAECWAQGGVLKISDHSEGGSHPISETEKPRLVAVTVHRQRQKWAEIDRATSTRARELQPKIAVAQCFARVNTGVQGGSLLLSPGRRG